MARGFSNALRIALGGVAGGLEGYGAKQERLREEQRQIAREEAAAKREAAALARELARDERAAVSQGWQEASTYSGLSPRDMPGATPRKPFATTMIGDKSYVMPESEQVGAHREALMKGQQLKQQAAKQQQAFMASAKGAGFSDRDISKLEAVRALPAGMQGVAMARLFPAPERGGTTTERETPIKEEAQGMTFLEGNRRNQQVMNALNTVLAANPRLTPGRAAYQIMTQMQKERESAALSAQREAAADRRRTVAPPPGSAPAGRPVSPPPASAASGMTRDELKAAGFSDEEITAYLNQ